MKKNSQAKVFQIFSTFGLLSLIVIVFGLYFLSAAEGAESNWEIITELETDWSFSIIEDLKQEVNVHLTELENGIIELTLFEHENSTTKGGYQLKMALCGDGNKSLKYANEDAQGGFDNAVYLDTLYGNLVNYGLNETWCNETGEGFILFSAGSKNKFPKKIRLNVSEFDNFIIYAGTGSAVIYVDAGSIASDLAPPITAAPTCPTHQADDILIVSAYNTDGEAMSTTTPGWAEITQINGGADDMAWYWKRATGSGTAGATIEAADDDQFVICYVIRGAKTTGDPFEAGFTVADNSSAATDGPLKYTSTITTSGPDRMVVHFYNGNDNNDPWNTAPPPSGWTLQDFQTTGDGSDGTFLVMSKNVSSATTIPPAYIGDIGATELSGGLTIAFIPINVHWNQSSLNMGESVNNITSVVEINSEGANTDATVTCSGNCTQITTNWTQRTMTNGQSDQVLITCSNATEGEFQAIFNVTSDEGTSDNLFTVDCEIFSHGKLIVNITKPDDDSDWAQYDSNLTINATVTCEGGANAKCGTVYALARYNLTADPDTAVNITKGGTPFYIYEGGAGLYENQTDGFDIYDAGSASSFGMTFDSTDDSFWVIDTGDVFVYHFNSAGVKQLDGFSISGVVNAPRAIAFDPTDDSLWVTGSVDDFVYHFNSSGDNQTDGFYVGGAGATSPFGMAFDTTDDSFWVTDYTYDFVYHFNSTGDNQTDGFKFGDSGSDRGYGIAFDTTDDSFWVTDEEDDFVYHFNSSGDNQTDGFYVGGAGAVTPYGIAFDTTDDSFWVNCVSTNFIYHFSVGIENPQSKMLNQGDSFNVSWQLNITTASTELYLIDVKFNSSYGDALVSDNNTADRQVNLNPSVEAFFLVKLRYPINWTNTTDTTPNFEFNSTGTASSYSCELFLNDTGYGTSPTASNATNINITANASLDGIYNWNINCTAGSTTNTSLIRVINVSVVDTCTYSGSGTWNVDCDDYCNISSNVNLMGNDIYITGTGRFTTTARITNWTNRYLSGTDSNNRCLVYSLAGGGFGP